MASPIKGLSVRKDKDGAKALHSKVSKEKYKCISNFFFTIKACVKFPPKDKLCRYNGWILDVQRTDNVSMDCFVTCDEMQSVKHLKIAINRRFNENCGVYWNNLTDAQLTNYIWTKVREFMCNGGKTLVGTLTTGRQHFMKKRNDEGELIPMDESDLADLESCKDAVDDYDESTYIINEKLQVNRHGEIPEENWKFIWMVPHLRLMPATKSDNEVKSYLEGSLENYVIKIDRPRSLGVFKWKEFICHAKAFFKVNFMPFMVLLSAGIGTYHFEKVLSLIHSCPVPTAVGDVSCGKSTALKLISQLFGLHTVSKSSGEFIISYLKRTTFPLCWDDPTRQSSTVGPLVSVFNGRGQQTKERGNETPRSSFLLTVNFTMDDNMRAFERTIPIWFNKIITQECEGGNDFLNDKKKMFSFANTHAVMDVIALCTRINHESIQEHMKYFTQQLTGFSPRLAEIYCVFRLVSHLIIELVNDNDIIDKTSLDNYLTKEFVPYVTSFYDVTEKAHTSINEIFQLFVETIEKRKLDKDEVGKWIRHMIKGKKDCKNVSYIAFLVPTALQCVKDAELPAPSDVSVREIVHKVKGATTDYKSIFVGQPKKVVCCRIPRHAINKETLAQIDKVFSDEIFDDTSDEGELLDEEKRATCDTCERITEEIQAVRERHMTEMQDARDWYQSEIESVRQDLCARLAEKDEEIDDLQNEIRLLRERKDSTRTSCTRGPSVVATAIENIVASVAENQGVSRESLGADTSGQITENSQETSFSPMTTLNDSGLGLEANESVNYVVDKDNDRDASLRKKRSGSPSIKPKDRCNLCSKKKTSGMLECITCKQWQHFGCAGRKYLKDTKSIETSFKCSDCK